MALYSIEDTTLTALGDALRSKVGETRFELVNETPVISKSYNVTDLSTYTDCNQAGEFYDVVRIEGASKIVVKMYYQTSNVSHYIKVASGEWSSMPTGTAYKGIVRSYVELIFEDTDTVTFCHYDYSADNHYLGYYAECTGYAEVKNTMSPVTMATTIANELMNKADDTGANIAQRTITEFNSDNITEIGINAFYGCTALTKVNTPNVTKLKEGCFRACALTEINFPSVTHIDNSVFTSCSSLERAYLPQLINCGYMTFYSCKDLRWVDMGCVPNIGMNSFTSCTSLEALILRKTDAICTVHANAFPSSSITSGTGYIYVPAALLEEYKAATNWTVYADQIRAIEDYPDICGGE